MLELPTGLNNHLILSYYCKRVAIFGLVLFIYQFSTIIFTVYTNGDLTHYNYVYENVRHYNIVEAYTVYVKNIGSLELPHFLIIYYAGDLVSRENFVTISNLILVAVSYKAMRGFGANLYVAVLFLVSNFYFFVLYIPAERLKFALIILFLAVIFLHKYRVKLGFFCIVLAVLTHISIAILLVPFIFKKALPIFKAEPIYAGVAVAISCVALYLSWPHLLSKYTSSSALGGEWDDIAKVFIMLCFSLACVPKRSENLVFVFFTFIWIGLCVFILGGSRINMFAFFFFMYFSLGYKNGLNIFVLSLMAYFCYASYFFVIRAIQYGDAFYFAGTG